MVELTRPEKQQYSLLTGKGRVGTISEEELACFRALKAKKKGLPLQVRNAPALTGAFVPWIQYNCTARDREFSILAGAV